MEHIILKRKKQKKKAKQSRKKNKNKTNYTGFAIILYSQNNRRNVHITTRSYLI